MCCDFHIGLKFTNKHMDCKQKCNKLVYGLDVEKNKIK